MQRSSFDKHHMQRSFDKHHMQRSSFDKHHMQRSSFDKHHRFNEKHNSSFTQAGAPQEQQLPPYPR